MCSSDLHVGVIPDVEVLLTDEDIDQQRDSQAIRAVEVLRSQTRSP